LLWREAMAAELVERASHVDGPDPFSAAIKK
jgi:hypothetical protein